MRETAIAIRDMSIQANQYGNERLIFCENFREPHEMGANFIRDHIAPRVELILGRIEAESRKRNTMPRFIKLEAPDYIQTLFSKGGEFRIMRAFDVLSGDMVYRVEALVEM